MITELTRAAERLAATLPVHTHRKVERVTRVGSGPGTRMSVVIDGVTYRSKRQAQKILKLSQHKLERLLNGW